MATMAEFARLELHAVYPKTVYEVGMLGWHFAAIDAAWPHLLVLAALCTHDDEEPKARVAKILGLLEEPTIYFARDRDWQQWYRAVDPVHDEPPPVDETIADLAERELTVLTVPQLIFQRIKLDSPLEIMVVAAEGTGVIRYALHLLRAFLRNPEGIGGWLPSLTWGWHKARRDAEMARQEHQVEVIRGQLTDLLIKQNMSTLMRLAQNPELQDLHPTQVSLIGADDKTPEDIKDALEAQQAFEDHQKSTWQLSAQAKFRLGRVRD
jgi:hypothetical protein